MDKLDDIKKLFGDRVKKLRLSRNLTQEDLAHEMELEDSRQIRVIEKGEVFVNLKTVARLAMVFGVEVKELFKF